MTTRLFLTLCTILSACLRSILAFAPLHASVTKPNCDEPAHNDVEVEQIIRETLKRIALGYESHTDKMKRIMEMEIELSEKTETCLVRSGGKMKSNMVLSDKLRGKRKSMEDCLGANKIIMQRLLLGWLDGDASKNDKLFQRIECIPSTRVKDDVSLCSLMGNGGVADAQMKETEGYDTAQQVIWHTSRDWTFESSPCRDATNGWIIRAIAEHCSGIDKIRVLVPGAGLCRLAYDISTCGDVLMAGTEICVDANDSSVTMAFAAKSVLDMVQAQAVSKIFPFVSDPQRNEIHSSKRFEMHVFPDEEALSSYRNYSLMKQDSPVLTYTVGDFLSTYSQNSKRGMYNVIATSFFIDTATNIYEYIFIMKHLLQKDGLSIWVNCGPVQWHPCAMIRPTVDELKGILEVCGFDLITWEVAQETSAYRHPDEIAPVVPRYTREEGYRPLRFVAHLCESESEDTTGDVRERIEYIEYLNEVANGKVKE